MKTMLIWRPVSIFYYFKKLHVTIIYIIIIIIEVRKNVFQADTLITLSVYPLFAVFFTEPSGIPGIIIFKISIYLIAIPMSFGLLCNIVKYDKKSKYFNHIIVSVLIMFHKMTKALDRTTKFYIVSLSKITIKIISVDFLKYFFLNWSN